MVNLLKSFDHLLKSFDHPPENFDHPPENFGHTPEKFGQAQAGTTWGLSFAALYRLCQPGQAHQDFVQLPESFVKPPEKFGQVREKFHLRLIPSLRKFAQFTPVIRVRRS